MPDTVKDFDADLLNAFLSKERSVVAFVGSGPSSASGLYSWSELLRRVAAELELGPAVENALKERDYIGVATFLEKERSGIIVKEKVAKQVKHSAVRPHRIHQLIVQIPFAGIITTNYDTLLTDADETRVFNLPITYRTSGLRDHLQERFMLHLHGYVDDPDTIIITLDGYDHINFQEPIIQDFLTSVFATKTVLFIGFGFADQHIEHLLGRLRANKVIGNFTVFALIPFSGTPNQVRDRKLKDQLVNPVYMQDSGDFGVAAIVKWLSSLHDALNQIALSRKSSLAAEKPYLVDQLSNLFLSDNWPSLLTDPLMLLPNRPDLRKIVRTGLTTPDIRALFDNLSSNEFRQILIQLNKVKRSSAIEDALSCLPSI